MLNYGDVTKCFKLQGWNRLLAGTAFLGDIKREHSQNSHKNRVRLSFLIPGALPKMAKKLF